MWLLAVLRALPRVAHILHLRCTVRCGWWCDSARHEHAMPCVALEEKLTSWRSQRSCCLHRFWPVRKYPWGSCEALSSEHSDFAALKKLLLETSFEELKEATEKRYYKFREQELLNLTDPDTGRASLPYLHLQTWLPKVGCARETPYVVQNTQASRVLCDGRAQFPMRMLCSWSVHGLQQAQVNRARVRSPCTFPRINVAVPAVHRFCMAGLVERVSVLGAGAPSSRASS